MATMTKSEAAGYANILGGANVALVESKEDRFKLYDFLLAVGKLRDEINKMMEDCKETITDEKERIEYINKIAAEDAGVEEIKLSKESFYGLIDSNKDRFALGAVNALAKLME